MPDEERTSPGPAVLGPAGDETTPLLSKPPAPRDDDAATAAAAAAAAAADDEDEDEDEATVLAEETSSPRLVLVLGTAYVGVFLGAVDSSIIATLSGPIASEFRSLSLLSWLATAYLIANAACQPLSGRLTDVFGRGPGLVFSNLLFAAGNLVCGLARGESAMVLGRVVAGVGGGGLMSIATILASDLVPLRKRGVVQGVGNIAYGSGAMLGGVFGGVVNDNSSWGWRLAFLIQVPVSVVSAVLVLFLVRVPPKASSRSLVARIDFTGALLIVAFLVVLLLGLNAGGNLVPWTHPLVLATPPLSCAILAALVVWESRARQPILPVRLLATRTVLAACVANLAGTMVIMIVLFFVPLYLQVLGASATDASLRVLASPLGISACSVGAGYAMKRTGRYRGLGVAVVSLQVAGAAVLLAGLSTARPAAWPPFVGLLLAGAGYGGMLTVALLACISAVDHAHQAVVTSATYAFRSVGATVGIAAASAAYQNVLLAGLRRRFPGEDEMIGRVRDDLGELRRLPQEWREGALEAFVDAFRAVWLTALGAAVVGLAAAALMRQHKLHSNISRREE